MAFEDDMIEAGYSDEQEYLDSLIDDFEDNYRRQQDRELEYDDDYDSYYYMRQVPVPLAHLWAHIFVCFSLTLVDYYRKSLKNLHF